MFQVTFPEIARVLQTLRSSVAAAEGHGCLCGALCTAPHYPVERWLDELIEDQQSDAGSQGPLRLLFADTLRALSGDEMEFQLLLPDDDAVLEERAAALALWCQGFLYGFGTGRPVQPAHMTAQVDEVLRDLMHISRAEVDTGEAGEAEEQAYAEIVEYVRVGVQLIHEELRVARESDASCDQQDPDMSGPGHVRPN